MVTHHLTFFYACEKKDAFAITLKHRCTKALRRYIDKFNQNTTFIYPHLFAYIKSLHYLCSIKMRESLNNY